jgi:DNA-binding CsgD family transcriptional regulator/PAS domain-containing protein
VLVPALFSAAFSLEASMEDRAFSEVIGAMYEGAGDVAEWPGILDRVYRYVGGTCGEMTVVNRRSGEAAFGFIANHSPSGLEEYQRHYLPSDPRLLRLRGHPFRAFRCVDLVDAETFERSALVHDLLDPAEVRWCIVGFYEMNEQIAAFASAMRPRKLGPFTVQERDRLDRLMPHLRRLLALQLKVNSLEAQLAGHAGLIQGLETGVIMAAADGRVLGANPAAEAMLRAGDGLGTQQGLISAGAHALTIRLRAMIRAVADSRASGTAGPNSLLLERPSGAGPYVIVILPLPREHRIMTTVARADVILLVTDPARASATPAALLTALGLTTAEARVALALAGGERLEVIAEEHGVALSTVRSQLLAIFRKTGCNRQVDLIRFLDSITALRLRFSSAENVGPQSD